MDVAEGSAVYTCTRRLLTWTHPFTPKTPLVLPHHDNQMTLVLP